MTSVSPALSLKTGNNYRHIHFCRLCTSNQLFPILDLGEQYLVSFTPDGEGIRIPVAVLLCKQCGLPQLSVTVNPDTIYQDYGYKSGMNQTMSNALLDVVNAAQKHIHLAAGDRVLDIGANDGTLLKHYPEEVYKIGVDPAKNIEMRGMNYAIKDYFRHSLISEPVKVVTSVAMFYDVDRPLDFMSDVADILTPDGLWINQLNYYPKVLKSNTIDFFSSEHITCWNLALMMGALPKVGLEVMDVDVLEFLGGSIRLYIQHKGARPIQTNRVKAVLQYEQPLSTIAAWRQFAMRADRNRQKLVAMITRLTDSGKKVLVYGASTRGNSLLQYYGLDHTLLPFAADKDASKWGKKMVGTRIPIISEEEAREMRPDYFLILPYSYTNEFLKREQAFRGRGGKFIVPLPKVRIV